MKYEFDGDKYKQASSQQKTWGKKLISELKLKGNERILDLGCGDGLLTAELAEHVIDGFVLGIDASESMIETAGRDHPGDNIRFELLDINAIDFDSEFDVVFSNATLHWIKDHSRLLSNVFKSLKPGGLVRFQFAAEGNCTNLISVLQELILEKAYAGYFKEFDWPWYMPAPEQYCKLLDRIPFAEKDLWCEDADRYFESIEAMVKWIDQPSIVPFLACIAEKDKKCFRDTIVERMIKRTLQDDGTCFETFRRMNIRARK